MKIIDKVSNFNVKDFLYTVKIKYQILYQSLSAKIT